MGRLSATSSQTHDSSVHLWLCTQHVFLQITNRFARIAASARSVFLYLMTLIPGTTAASDSANDFHARQPYDNETDQVQSDVSSMTSSFNFRAWQHRGTQIRKGNNRAHCIGNLSLALSEVAALSTSSSQGASGALSLLPTAGALIGAPAKELWVLYKLMPVAGVLSMILSLGGNIVPMDATDYELSSTAFSYGGLIATRERQVDRKADALDSNADFLPPSEVFANKVAKRAEEKRGSSKRLLVGMGVCCQLCWFAILMFACYLAQSGGVVAWWCKAWGWMYLWYLMVVLSSFLENFAGVPFSKQWTIRVSAAPKVRISSSAPIVTHTEVSSAVINSNSLLPNLAPGQASPVVGPNGSSPASTYQPVPTESQEKIRKRSYTPPNEQRPHLAQSGSNLTSQGHLQQRSESWLPPNVGSVTPLTHGDRTHTGASTIMSLNENLLQDLDTGYNTKGRIIMDPDEPFSVPRTPFYVIISLDGISPLHAALRVISKAISVGVFAAGTATFASATLITISVALTVLCLVLAAGVFGRVAALWMASEMMSTDPVLHKVVKDRQEATEYIDAILRRPDLVFEIMGHVVINGRCVSRYNKWLRWGTFFGVLAPPFDVASLAV